MGYSFDGDNKLISLTAGTVAFDVTDLYSRWMDWLAQGENLKYSPALRFVGGDAISETKNLGVTFFVINGWRIRPQEANHTLRVSGNLYTDPAGSSPFVPTLGAYNVMIEMTVSSLVDSTLAQMEEIEQASFEGDVTISASTGTAGTAYPVGTRRSPVSNLADAKTIASTRGIDSFFILGNLTLGATDNVAGLRFEGDGSTLNVTRTTITLTQGCVTTNTHWRNAKIIGYQGGESNYHDCIIDGLDNAHCFYERCGMIDGTSRGYTIRQATVSSGHASYFKECYSDEGTFILDRNSSKLNVTFDHFAGRILIKNQNRPDNGASDRSGNVYLHMDGGTVMIDSTCTTGSIVVSGTCNVVNNSGGTVVDVSQVSASWSDTASNFNGSGTMGAKLNTAAGGSVDYNALAAAILALAETSPIHADVKKMNGAAVVGDGTSGNKWRGA